MGSILFSQLRLAAELWNEISERTDPADRLMANFFHRRRRTLGSRDRRFLSETIYSVFRHKSFLEEWIKNIKQKQGTGGEVWSVPCLADALVFFAAAAEGLIPIGEFCAVWGEPARAALAPEKLYQDLIDRKLPDGLIFESKEAEWAVKYSFPEWLVRRWFTRYGEEQCVRLLEICQQRPPLVVRTNVLKISRDDLLERFRKRGHEAHKTEKSPWGILFARRENLFDSEEFRDGFFEVQDEGSQLLCQAMDAKPGEVIWDVCAGGGGKSLALAAAMNNKGRIIATDIRSWKLDDLKLRARRGGVFNIFPADIHRLDEISKLKDGADKILVDAPCSGTGTLRRNPDARWKLSEDRIKACRSDQLSIVQKALPYLKKCGKLYYATCSLEPEENEEVVRQVLEDNVDLKLAGDGFLRFLPQRDGTDGFFMAVLEKVS